jgi:large subunit ribosomal protein L29
MKPAEMRELTETVLKEKVAAWNEEIFNLRFQAKLGQLTNPLRFRTLRRDIARAITILDQKKNDAAPKKA